MTNTVHHFLHYLIDITLCQRFIFLAIFVIDPALFEIKWWLLLTWVVPDSQTLPYHAKLNSNLSLVSLRKATKSKFTASTFQPEPLPKLRYPWFSLQMLENVDTKNKTSAHGNSIKITTQAGNDVKSNICWN